MQCGLQGSDRYDPEPSGDPGVGRAIETRFKRARACDGRPRNRQRGQSLVEFALVVPLLLLVIVVLGDFGRIFATGVEIEAATRDAAESGANEYISNPPGGGTVPLSSPAPKPGDPGYDPAYYDALHLKVAKVVCTELRDQPNATYDSATQSCASMPVILVCVHDGADPSCNKLAFDPSGSVRSECTDLTPSPNNNQEAGSQERWVEVRACYQFTSLLGIPVPPVGEYWIQRTRTFVIPCYFALGTDPCG